MFTAVTFKPTVKIVAQTPTEVIQSGVYSPDNTENAVKLFFSEDGATEVLTRVEPDGIMVLWTVRDNSLTGDPVFYHPLEQYL